MSRLLISYHMVPVDPDDHYLLGIQWDGRLNII